MLILARLGEGDLLETNKRKQGFQSGEDDDEEDCNCVFLLFLVGLLYLDL